MSRDLIKGSQQKDRSFLSRWSARKNSIAKGEVVSDEKSIEVQEDLIEAEDEDAALTDEELLKKYELIDPKEIKDEIGLSQFLEGNVPERLRQMALRRLWHLNPLFGHVCDMVEYGEDYTDAATVIEGMQTAYQVGKGYNTKPLEAEAAEPESVVTAEADDGSADNALAEENNGNENEIEDRDSSGAALDKKGDEPAANEKKVSPNNSIESKSGGVQGNETYSRKLNDTDDSELNGYILPVNDIPFLSNDDQLSTTVGEVERDKEQQVLDKDHCELVAPLSASLENSDAVVSAPKKSTEVRVRPSRMAFTNRKNNP